MLLYSQNVSDKKQYSIKEQKKLKKLSVSLFQSFSDPHGSQTIAVSSRLSFRQSSPSRANYALLCRLLIDGGNQALNVVFSKIYPPLTLTENLSKPQVQKTLRRLKNQGMFFFCVCSHT